MISIVLVGARGHMGHAIEQVVEGMEDVRIAARIDERWAEREPNPGSRPKGPGYGEHGAPEGEKALARLVRPGDVVVDFSAPEGLRRAARVCRDQALPLVSGTTGLTAEDGRLLDELARVAPVLHASNFSLGAATLLRAVEAALSNLPDTWDIEIIERHHRGKADSPSGTALQLARAAAARRGLPEDAFRHGRQGRLGPRGRREIGLHAVRGGTWVGDHAVLLAGEGETLELRHVVEDRTAFAHGALAAARFVVRARPGRYSLDDALQPARVSR